MKNKKNQKSCTLVINNRKKFEHDLWNTEAGFSKEDFRKWFENARKHLVLIYNEKSKDESMESQADYYMLGDIINMLYNMDIKIEER